VSYNESLIGFMWGGKLCAQDVWANGLYGRCDSYQKDITLDSFGYENNQTSNIDVIEVAYKLLPGKWTSKHEAGINLGINREIFDYQNKIVGYWHLEIKQDKDLLMTFLDVAGPQQTELRVITTYDKDHQSYSKVLQINTLNKTTLFAKRRFDNILLTRDE
jgi:hypothetical protein